MSTPSDTRPSASGGGEPATAPSRDMRLHPDRPTVTRLSRKVLLGIGGVVTAGIAAGLLFALSPQHSEQSTQSPATANRQPPEGLADLPHDYAHLPRPAPKLGPPLPGDLGKPILDAGVQPPTMPAPGVLTPEQQQAAQERDAARKSHLFVRAVASNVAPSAAEPPGPATVRSSETAAGTIASGVEPMDHKLAFLNATTDHRTESPDRIETPSSPYILQAGSIIPAALITGLRSDLPGDVTAQVTQDCYDGPSGTVLLVPQGSRLIGTYDAQVSFGQSRALLVWTRLIFPNGKSIVLERQPATDTEGYAGLEDQIDNHWGTLFKAAILSTVLSVGSEAGTSNSANNLAQAIRQGASQSFSQIGEQLVGRSLNVQPTITIRPGFPVDVLVTRDLVLEPYKD